VASSFRKGATFTGKTIFIQRAPNLTQNGELEYCNDCPDATARNGRLIPVCIADFVSPVNLKNYSPEVQQGYERLLEQLNIEL
jgi:hypothetical protein